MLHSEVPGDRMGKLPAMTTAGLNSTTDISLRAYLLGMAWAHDEPTDREATQGS